MSKKMKVVIILVLVAVIFGVIFYFASAPVKSADSFFSLIKAGNISEAYQSTSEQFKQNTNAEQFKSFMEGSSINKFDSVFWNSREVDTTGGKLEGNLKTTDGKTIPVQVKLIKEDDQWKILSINAEGGVESGVSKAKTIPSNSDLIKLTKDTIALYARTVKNGNFSDFYNSISKLWQNQITEEEFKDAFENTETDLTALEDITPVFSDAPTFGDSGELILKGYYLYLGYTINFTLKYIYENPSWKLIGINVSLQP